MIIQRERDCTCTICRKPYKSKVAVSKYCHSCRKTAGYRKDNERRRVQHAQDKPPCPVCGKPAKRVTCLEPHCITMHKMVLSRDANRARKRREGAIPLGTIITKECPCGHKFETEKSGRIYCADCQKHRKNRPRERKIVEDVGYQSDIRADGIKYLLQNGYLSTITVGQLRSVGYTDAQIIRLKDEYPDFRHPEKGPIGVEKIMTERSKAA